MFYDVYVGGLLAKAAFYNFLSCSVTESDKRNLKACMQCKKYRSKRQYLKKFAVESFFFDSSTYRENVGTS